MNPIIVDAFYFARETIRTVEEVLSVYSDNESHLALTEVMLAQIMYDYLRQVKDSLQAPILLKVVS